MKKWAGILMAVLFAASLPGCSHVTVSQSRVPESERAAEGGAMSSRGGTVSSETEKAFTGLQKGDSVSVKGENGDFGLHGIDFLDEDTGWMIEDRYHPKADDVFSQLLTTGDGGKSWTKIGTDGSKLDVVHFVTKTVGWAVSRGRNNTDPDATTQYAVLHTTDGGVSWSIQWKSGTLPDSIPALRFTDRQTGYALLGGKMLRTCNGGKNWTPVSFGAQDFIPSCFAFSDVQNGWAAGASAKNDSFAVLHTSDGGASWHLQLRQKGDGPMGIIEIDFLSGREGWFLSSDMSTMDGELYHTADGGAQWQPISKVRCARPSPMGLCFVDSQTGWIPLDHGAGPIDGGLSYTRDGGRTFHILGETDAEGDGPRAITNAREITFLSKQTGWAVGYDSEHGSDLLRTKDGGTTWEQLYPAVCPTVDVSFPDESHGFGLGSLSDPGALLSTADGGENWKTVTSFTGRYLPQRLSFLSALEGWLVALPVNTPVDPNTPVILHTSDGGKNWAEVGRLSPYDPACSYFRFFDGKHGVLIQTGAKDRILQTQDSGKTWRLALENKTDGYPGQFYFSTPSNGWCVHTVGVGKASRMEWSRTTDGGASWSSPVPVTSRADGYESFAVCFASPSIGILLAGGNGRLELLTTRDGGQNWDTHPLPESSSGSIDLVERQLSMQLTNDGRGWILAPYGLLQTVDGGRSWVWK